MHYLVFQKEKCPETGRLHWQGFVVLKEALYLKQLKELFADPTIHIEAARDGRRAMDYCKKPESRIEGPWEFGDVNMVKVRGTRSDLEEIKLFLDEGASETFIAENFFGQWTRYHRAFTRYSFIRCKPRSRKPFVTVLFGPPGMGKSRYVYSRYPDAFPLSEGNRGDIWWDGYDPNVHDTVIIDDFYGWIKYSLMLKLLDRYPLIVDVKGTRCQFRATRIFITSNKRPESWYPNVKEKEALLRRIERSCFIQDILLPEVPEDELPLAPPLPKIVGGEDDTAPQGGPRREVIGNTDDHLAEKFLPNDFVDNY